jgi:hypothetical protein
VSAVVRRLNPVESRVPLTTEQAAWLAGLIDGEGWLGLKLERNRRRYPVLQIEMTDYETLVVAHRYLKTFGSPSWTNIPARARRHKPSYRVTLRRPESILAMLKVVGPYLVTKRGAAKTARLAAHNNMRLRAPVVAMKEAA